MRYSRRLRDLIIRGHRRADGWTKVIFHPGHAA
jgi:hypothetical protein